MKRRTRGRVAVSRRARALRLAPLGVALALTACGDVREAAPEASTEATPETPTGAPIRPLAVVRSGSLTVSSLVMPAPIVPERAALYLSVANGGDRADTLMAVDVGGLGSAGLHSTEMAGQVARMRPSGPVPVAGGAAVDFRPGALHVMVDDLARELQAGDTVPVRLRFAREGWVEARAVVVPYAELERILDPAG